MPYWGGANKMQLSPSVEPMDLDNEADEPPPAPHAQPAAAQLIADNPSVDLDQLAAAYDGYAKMQRLLYVADHCPTLRLDALGLLVRHLKANTFDVANYQNAMGKLQAAQAELAAPGALANGPDMAAAGEAALDQHWLEQTHKRASLTTEKLDTDLKHYKSNSIKESIRRGQDDLGEHYVKMGLLSDALKCFSRARDYCTSCKHLVNMCFNVIKVSVYLHNWPLVLNYVGRAETSADVANPQPGRESTEWRLQALAKLRAAGGLAELAGRKYKQAARLLLQISIDHLNYSDVLSAHDVAVYGSLCALATYERADLQKHVLNNSAFKQFLELQPALADVMRKFNESAYDACLRQLDALKDNLLLDMYLAPHVAPLYGLIRNRAMVQYFSPYLSADMCRMARAFNTSVPALEDEFAQLILDGQLKARVDSHNKLVYAKDVDQRSSAYEHAIVAGRRLQERARAVVLRAALQRAKLCVRAPIGRDVSHSRNAAAAAAAAAPPPAVPNDFGGGGGETPSNSGESSPQD